MGGPEDPSAISVGIGFGSGRRDILCCLAKAGSIRWQSAPLSRRRFSVTDKPPKESFPEIKNFLKFFVDFAFVVKVDFLFETEVVVEAKANVSKVIVGVSKVGRRVLLVLLPGSLGTNGETRVPSFKFCCPMTSRFENPDCQWLRHLQLLFLFLCVYVC